ncbi:MAG TPA: hypothetical protein VFL91_05235 [Thermomicrobiales bacterium]|nr:hypothetical protein [Thermomicrobiales bacterium]
MPHPPPPNRQLPLPLSPAPGPHPALPSDLVTLRADQVWRTAPGAVRAQIRTAILQILQEVLDEYATPR